MLVGDVSFAHIALQLNLDELSLDDEPQYFDDVTHDLIRRDRLDQTYRIFGLKICNLVLDVPDDLETIGLKLQLRINVDCV